MTAPSQRERAECFERLRPRLYGVAFRMLQTRADAEEVVQEAWVRLAGVNRVESVEGFLLRTTTRLCLDREKSARRRRETYVGPWIAELVDAGPTPESETERLQSLNLGLLHVLLKLSPLERAVFLLREAFDYPYGQIAAVVGRREVACRQIARRAREKVRGEGGAVEVDADRHQELLGAFLGAARDGKIERLEEMLSDEVVLVSDSGGRVVSARRPVRGRNDVARFMVGIARKASADTSVEFTMLNGAPAAVVRSGGDVPTVFGLQLVGAEIRRIFVIRNPEKVAAVSRP